MVRLAGLGWGLRGASGRLASDGSQLTARRGKLRVDFER
jgi:hypothetical protein